jgi:PAS domain S-box-containing protein
MQMDKVLAVLCQTTDGAFAVDWAQRIVFWNAAAEDLLGYRVEEVKGRTCYDVFCGKARPGCLQCAPNCPVPDAARNGEIVPSYNLLSQTKVGIPLLLSVSVITPPASNSAIATIHLFRDITHQWYYETYIEEIIRAAAHLPPPQISPGRYASTRGPRPGPLTSREKEVLYLLAQGKPPREIATTLDLSYATVRNYLQNILYKFGVHSQRQAVKLALERRLL